jgi:hypothetical protein
MGARHEKWISFHLANATIRPSSDPSVTLRNTSWVSPAIERAMPRCIPQGDGGVGGWPDCRIRQMEASRRSCRSPSKSQEKSQEKEHTIMRPLPHPLLMTRTHTIEKPIAVFLKVTEGSEDGRIVAFAKWKLPVAPADRRRNEEQIRAMLVVKYFSHHSVTSGFFGNMVVSKSLWKLP